MSEHAIEDLVSNSIRVLDACTPAEAPLRDEFAALYRFQDGFDCKFTHFRVMDILLRRRFTYRFPLDRHPDHAERGAYLRSLTEFTALRAFDDDTDDFDGWLEDGYVEPPHLYCDAGTALWRRLVDAGALGGPDAVPPARARLVEVVQAVAAGAERVGDVELIAMWHSLGPVPLFGAVVPFAVEDLEADPAVVRLLEIVRRTGAGSVELFHDYRPPPEVIAEDQLESWWYATAN
jgi:hypothetical protein